MRYSSQGRFGQQVRFLATSVSSGRRSAVQQCALRGGIAQALTAIDVRWVDRIYSPLVTLWVFLGQVLSADHSCRGGRPLDRPSSVARRAFVFRGDWCLLPGQKTSARRVFLERGSSDWTCIRDRCRSAVALETTSRLRIRWIDGIDARHAGEPAGLSATRYAETRLGLSPSTNRGRLFSLLRCGS